MSGFTTSAVKGLLGMFILAALAACSDSGGRKLDLMDRPSSKDAEAERLRRMQMVRVVDDNGAVHEWDADELREAMESKCVPVDLPVSGSCGAASVVAIQATYCEAQLAMAMGSAVEDVSFGPFEDHPNNYRVLPQSAATNAALAQQAFQQFVLAIKSSEQVIRQSIPFDSGDAVTCTVADLNAASATLGSVIADSYHLAWKAIEVAVKNTLAVSDAELSSTPLRSLATARSVSNPALSRSAAAHLLIGGSAGINGSTTRAFCTSHELSAPAKAAMSALRESGIGPDKIIALKEFLPPDSTASEISTSTLLETTTSTGSYGGSVRQRLEDRYGTLIPTNFDVPSFLGLSLNDFEEARRYMAEEILAFGRSQQATLPDIPLEGNRQPLFHRFVATTSPPPQRDPAFFDAIARSRQSEVYYQYWRFFTNNNPDSLSYGATFADLPDLAEFTDWAHTWAHWIATRGPIVSNPVLNQNLLQPMHLMMSDGARVGRLVHCNEQSDDGTPGFHSFTVDGFSGDDNLRVVIGEDAMECAVSGTIEGAPCSMDQQIQVPLVLDTSPHLSFQKAVNVSFSFAEPGYPLLKERWYLLAPRTPGSSAVTAGAFKTLAGFDLRVRRELSQYCEDIPLVPEAQARAAAVLEPSREWCAQSSLTCVGNERFDERLPLEDELTKDEQSVESSWRHYLTLARQAANESDLLGKEYFEAALAPLVQGQEDDLRQQAQREKAAAELETLQGVCGTAVDVSALLDALGTDSSGVFNLSKIDQGPCVTPMPPNTTCVGNRAITDWKALAAGTPALSKLGECLASFVEVAPFTQLGDSDICLWTDSTGKICGGVHPETCPSLKKENRIIPPATEPVCPQPAGTTRQVVSKDDGLHFFATSSVISPAPEKNLCDHLRDLRRTPGNQVLIDEVKNSNIFNWSRLQELREHVSFTPEYGGWLTVKAGRRTFQTGTTTGGPGTDQWPCSTLGSTFCQSGDTSLMCSTFGCGNDIGRRAANKRLARAVMAAQLTSWRVGLPKPKFNLPAHLYFGAFPLDYTGPTQISVFPGAFPITVLANSRWREFQGDAAQDNPAGFFHDLGETTKWLVNPKTSPTSVAFGDFVPQDGDMIDDFDAFWGGMSQSRSTEGYFAKRLKEAAHNAQLPPNVKGRITEFGVPFIVDESCSLSCSISPFCDCDDQRHERQGDRLHEQQLEGPRVNGINMQPFFDSFLWDDEQALLDSAELLCESTKEGPGLMCDLANAPKLQSLADLNRVGNYLVCSGNDILRKAALTVFKDIPAEAIRVMNEQAVTNAFTPVPGEMGKAFSELRSALQQVSVSGPTIARTIRNFGDDMKSLQATIEKFSTHDEIANVQFASQAVEQVARCAGEIAAATGSVPWSGAAKATVACVNSIAQISFADRLRDLQQKSTEFDRETVIADFNKRFTDAVTSLELEAKHLSEAQEAINRQLGIIQGLQQTARRSVNRALWLMSYQAKFTFEIGAALSARKETARVRYERAHDNAKRMAFLAKRSIEQRLGLRLSDMSDDLPLVPAPNTWESTVCATSGLDFANLTETAADPANPRSFADSFIGDYVTKLENVIESYRLVNNFHEGSDVAVISLRDDVLNVRRTCETESPNLLYHASKLDYAYAISHDAEHSWFVDGCRQGEPGDCVMITPRTDAPFAALGAEVLSAPGYTLRFGDGVGCTAASCTWQPGVALVQKVSLTPGRYRFSWYVPPGRADVSVGVALGPNGQLTKLKQDHLAGETPGWDRVFYSFELEEPSDVRVGFAFPGATPGELVVGAPMLENVDITTGRNSSFPRPYSTTGDTRTSRRPVCEDTDGETFRRTKWDRGCMKLCPDGYASNCEGRAKTECFWETSFQLSQRGLEEGAILNQSGFARGNFNYRLDTLGVNFVGTGVRNCADSNLPSTCYGGGFVTYSLAHEGPYLVRNHKGADFRADLFTGNIENARGLGIERYFTNPLSSADRMLIDDYLRTEFQGRPLDGTFVLRVWDTPGVNFDAIKDVQLILNYRYWTRFH